MPAAVSTITSTGQVSLPKVIREILGVGPHDQVEFLSDGERVQVVAVPKDPLTLGTKEEFWERVSASLTEYAEGKYYEAEEATRILEERYGL